MINTYAPDINRLQELVDAGYLTKQKHPTEPLLIWNYSKRCQYEGFWNEDTEHCRGLITDLEGDVKARPFRKFYNYEEIDPKNIPVEPFGVYDKLDGSLGITFTANGKPQIATRGSFTSDQAIKANEILVKRGYDKHIDPEFTYLFEILYPANRIVVDYGGLEDLILLAIIHTETGAEMSLDGEHARPFNVVKRYDGVKDIARLRDKEIENAEGFVVRFASGLRVKLKFSDYVRLHHILTGVSNKTVWEMLMKHEPMDALYDRVPDEWFAWLKKTIAGLQSAYEAVERECKEAMASMPEGLERRWQAEYIKTHTCPYKGVMFSMLSGHDYEQAIWKLVKPTYAKPFAESEE